MAKRLTAKTVALPVNGEKESLRRPVFALPAGGEKVEPVPSASALGGTQEADGERLPLTLESQVSVVVRIKSEPRLFHATMADRDDRALSLSRCSPRDSLP
jgi:hypothetical protein